MFEIRQGEPADKANVCAILIESDLELVFADQGGFDRLVAVGEGGVVVGFLDGFFDLAVPERAQGAHSGPQAWVNCIAVAPTARLRGVGQALVGAFVDEAQQRDCSYLAAMISQRDDTTGRIAFFRSCGLRSLVPDTDDDLYGAPIAEILRAIGRVA